MRQRFGLGFAGRIDQRRICSRRARGRGFLFRRHGRDHPRAERLADLDRGDADAAGGAEHQQSLTAPQPAAIGQRMDRGRICHEQSRALLEAALGRQRDRAVGGNDDLLGKPAEPERGDQPVAL